MIDLNNIEKYRENNRLEAKKALGGLPKSIWETYSAFANTLGGLILLGVEEHKDRSLHTVDLPDPDSLIKEFWDIVNDPNKVSINILSSKDVYSLEVNGDHIIVINVPRADRSYKPVYIDGNPLNSYRRDGEGDYRCTREEFQAMERDAAVRTQDMRILEDMDLDVIDRDSLRDYRGRMKSSRPGHVWEQLDDEAFLLRIGAAGIGTDGEKHPTAAGLLMFGDHHDLVRVFNDHLLVHQELNDAGRATFRITSSSGGWSGNVYDFFFRVSERLSQGIKELLKDRGMTGEDEAAVCAALREALANCLVNADHWGRGGVAVIKRPELITMANPGTMRVGPDAAVSGGVSDPRNSAMAKMFDFIDIGERAGSGIPNIFRVWREQGWAEPAYTESMDPDRTVLSLPLSPEKAGDKRHEAETGDESASENERVRSSIIEYLTDNPQGNAAEIAEYIGSTPSRAGEYLKDLLGEGIIVGEGTESRIRAYRLKR